MSKSLNERKTDARIFAEETLDEPEFQKLEKHPRRDEVYQQVALAGKTAYDRTAEMMKEPGHEADDPMLPADYSQEAMRATLDRKLNELFPNRNTERDPALDDLLQML